MPAADAFFASDYHEARARFMLALEAFEQHAGRTFARERHVIDAEQDLSIDIAHMEAPRPERAFVVVSGIHGVEGYAGSAIQQALLASVLPACDLDTCGLVLVHSLNPSGMLHRRRVNASNVDLNRNFDAGDGSLYATDGAAYAKLADLLEPRTAYTLSVAERLHFLWGVLRAIRRHGFGPLRQATLGGQYAFERGLFFGGRDIQPETRTFQVCFEAVCGRYPELLLTDLHTGYGAFGAVSSLFPRVDSAELGELMSQGVRDGKGHDQSYAARGDLVGWCWSTAKRLQPGGTFNGAVVELGTHGLGVVAQLQDLYTVRGENQARHHGASSSQAARSIERAFSQLFDPAGPEWRKRVVSASLDHIQAILAARNFIE